MAKRILFISQQFPFPLTDGGNIRTFKILQALSSQYEVTLIGSACKGATPEESLASVQGLCADAVCLPDVKSRSLLGFLKLIFRVVTKRQPLTIAWNFNPHILREVKKRLGTGNFQAIHCNHLDTAQYLPENTQNYHCVLDSHNLLFQFYQMSAALEKQSIRRLFSYAESKLMKWYELGVIRRMNKILVCSDREARILSDHVPASKVSVVPNGVDCSYFHPPVSGYNAPVPTVILTGSMGYRPNSDAAIWFIHEVMPLLRKKCPKVIFMAVGKEPPPALSDLAKQQDDIIVSGQVPDVRQFVWKSSIFVVPIRLGAGTRLKVLEAFAMGIPAVSTQLGAQGIDYTDGANILIADTAEALADAILRLLGDPELQASLSERGLALAREKYDWNAVGRGLLLNYGI